MHGKGDVLIHRHTGDEAEILEDNAHLAAQVGDLVAAHPGHVPAVHKHLALAGHFLAENQLEQGGFARAGMAQQEHELAVVHMEVHILQRQLAALLYSLETCSKSIMRWILLTFEFVGQEFFRKKNRPASGFERPVLRRRPLQPPWRNINIWPGCWTGTS